MKRALYEQWLKALETAPKTVHVLKDSTGMCCLGVLCSLIPEVVWDGDNHAYYNSNRSLTSLPEPLSEELKFKSFGRAFLIDLNDFSKTFDPIIEVLRETPWLYFEIEDN